MAPRKAKATKRATGKQWTPIQTPLGKSNYPLEPEIKEKQVKGIKEYMVRYPFDTTKTIIVEHTISRGLKKKDGQFQQQNEDSVSGTVETYMQILKHLGNFASRIGDYRTALICDRKKCPHNPHPANPKTIIEFYYWKFYTKGATLMDSETNAPLNDILGRTILCTGDWNSPSGIDKANGALRMLHDAFNSCHGTYQEPCTDCLSENMPGTGNASNVKVHASCTYHANQPQLVYCGDPLKSKVYHKNYEQIKKTLKDNHVVKGNCQLLPQQVRTLRACLTTKNDIQDFQMWTMIIVGILLFLRADELLNMTVEHFLMEYTIASQSTVESVSAEVQGKADPRPVLLSLYRNDEFPEFCPLRAIFTYLKKTGIRSGPLFPKTEHLKLYMDDAQKVNSAEVLPHSYSAWNKRFKSLLQHQFPTIFGEGTTDPATIGTHTLRKTGYLFAVWGLLRTTRCAPDPERLSQNVLFANVLLSARHKTVMQASTYMIDACTHYERVALERFQETNAVGQWRSCIVVQRHLARANHGPSLPFQQKTLPLQSDWWQVKELPYVPVGGCTDLYRVACSRSGIMDEKDRMLAFLKTKLTPLQLKEAMDIRAQEIREATDIAVDRGGASSPSRPGTGNGKRSASSIEKEKDGRTFLKTGAVAKAVAAATASKPPPKKAKRGDKTMEREITFCDEAEEAYSSNRTPEGATTVWGTWIDFMSASDAVGGQKSLGSKAVKYYRSRRNNLKAMRACITGCFDGDKEDFLSSLPTFPAYRAKKIHHCTHSS
jgi:hypothetical protein